MGGGSNDGVTNDYDHSEVVIFAPFLLLGVGAFLRHTTKAFFVPYTMQLLIIGTLLGTFLRGNEW